MLMSAFSMCLKQGGNHFTYFTGTEVQILTLELLQGGGQPVKKRFRSTNTDA
jgi:hypothetical protein